MTIQEINKAYNRIIGSLDEKELKNAFDFLQGLIAGIREYSFQDRLNELQDTYKYMLRYRIEGLAGICRKVTVFEFADTLKADQVLQEKARSLPNVEIFTSSQTVKVDGNGEKVTSIRIKDRLTGEERDFPLDGIFVQIGLAANSAPFRNKLETTPTGEIKIDAFCRTTLPGVYAAGDVSNVPYKQIVIAMGEGAKAALSAFDDRIRGVI